MTRLLAITFLMAGLLTPAADQPARTDSFGDPLPAGARMRLGTNRFHIPFANSGALLAPDGKTFCELGVHDGRLFDAETGLRIPGPRGAFFAFSPDGRMVLSVENKQIFVWSVASGKQICTIHGDAPAVVSPDGRIVASRADSGAIQLSDATTGKELRRIADEAGGASRWLGDFTADGKRVAAMRQVGLKDKTPLTEVWDAVSGKRIVSVPGRFSLFSHDGAVLATLEQERDEEGKPRQGKISLWDASSGKRRCSFAAPDSRDCGADFSPDDRLIVASGSEHSELAETSTGKVVRRLDGFSSGFSPDGRLVTLEKGVEFRLIEAATGRTVQTLQGEVRNENAAFSPDGKKLFTLGKPVVRVWNPTTGRRLNDNVDLGNEYIVTTLAFSPDGKTLASADGAIRMWRSADGKELGQFRHRSAGEGLSFAANGRTLLEGSGRYAGVWDVETGTEKRQLKIKEEDAAIYLPNYPLGKVAIVNKERQTLRWWDTQTGAESESFSFAFSGWDAFTISPDGKKIAAVKYHGDAITLLDANKGTVLLSIKKKNSFACPLTFSPDGKVLVAGGEEMLTGYDAATGRLLFESAFKIGFSPRSLIFSPDGKTLTGLGADGTIRLWEMATGAEVRRINLNDWIWAYSFSPDGRTLAAADGCAILLWDLAQDATVGEPETLWADLIGNDAARAYRAVWGLALLRDKGTRFLGDHVRPAAMDEDRLNRLLADLDSDSFDARESASRELAGIGMAAGPALRTAAAGNLSAEGRHRVKELLDHLEGRTPTGEELRQLRAVQALEAVGSAEARAVLERLAKGAKPARLTAEARAACDRLAKRQQP